MNHEVEAETIGDWAGHTPKTESSSPSALSGGPQAPSRHEIEIEDLRSEISRYDDKLYLIERLVEQQAPFGSELANFRRRLLLLVRA